MKFRTGFVQGTVAVELIETVGELRASIKHLDDSTPIRFADPDTGWLMRLSPELQPDTALGYDSEGRMVFGTEEYWMQLKPYDELTEDES